MRHGLPAVGEISAPLRISLTSSSVALQMSAQSLQQTKLPHTHAVASAAIKVAAPVALRSKGCQNAGVARLVWLQDVPALQQSRVVVQASHAAPTSLHVLTMLPLAPRAIAGAALQMVPPQSVHKVPIELSCTWWLSSQQQHQPQSFGSGSKALHIEQWQQIEV